MYLLEKLNLLKGRKKDLKTAIPHLSEYVNPFLSSWDNGVLKKSNEFWLDIHQRNELLL
jgi:hypothetical protein